MEYWLGIYAEDHQRWKNVNGEIIPDELLLWVAHNPNNYRNEQYHVALGKNGNYLGDYSQFYPYYSICDMIT